MNILQEKALYHLTGQSDLSRIQESTLTQMSNEFPYFAPIHFFLAEKCREIDATHFEKVCQKTNLYFTNPYWLHYQLISHSEELKLPLAILEAPEMVDPLLAAKEDNSPEIPISVEPLPIGNSKEFFIPTIESVKEMMLNIDKQQKVEVTEEPLDEDELEPERLISKDDDETAATELSNSKISSLLSGQLANFKKPISDADQLGLPKDIMHTIDYFASQGIKIDLSQIPQDKLTSHLRRFTDWLKYLKSDNANPIELGTRKDLEDAVELFAHSSNESKEVLTESMADVLQKQGQIDKAIQLYIKLSFLNPEKSAYFATKIQHLKGIQ